MKKSFFKKSKGKSLFFSKKMREKKCRAIWLFWFADTRARAERALNSQRVRGASTHHLGSTCTNISARHVILDGGDTKTAKDTHTAD